MNSQAIKFFKDDAKEKLKNIFGFLDYRDGQEEVIDDILNKEDLVVVMPTGSGKSLCYQLPSLVFKNQTIVVSPLISLINDQVDGLNLLGINAKKLHSNLSAEENNLSFKRFQSGECKIIYMSPERLMTDNMLNNLQQLKLDMIVVDEAHCISKWGSSFRPEYERLSLLKNFFPNTVISAFTATADKATRADISNKLTNGEAKIIVKGFDRPNLFLAVEQKVNWKNQLLDFLLPRKEYSGIIYCLSRKGTDEVASFLNKEGFNALPYHAGHNAETLKNNQEKFMSDEKIIIVATIAFGMGIDKSDIRYVVHLNLPGSMEAFYQEIGRAGRDGLNADTLLIYGLNDLIIRRKMIEQGNDEFQYKLRENKRLDALLAYCETSSCRRKALLSYFDDDLIKCDNCDNCLNPPIVSDLSVFAQMLMSAIARTGQCFGSVHVIDIVIGSSNQKIMDKQHHLLPTFGVGKEKLKSFWQGLIRQMISSGLLMIDIENFGGLKITEEGMLVLKGNKKYLANVKETSKKAKVSKVSKVSNINKEKFKELDLMIFNELKKMRFELAKEQKLPAYLIFSDATLTEISIDKPINLNEFSRINGVGEKKLKRYGDLFVEKINQIKSKSNLKEENSVN